MSAALASGAALYSYPHRSKTERNRVEMGRCVWERAPPVCRLPSDRQLVAWVDRAAPSEVRLLFDGVAASVVTSTVQGGTRARVRAPPGARQLVVAVAKDRATEVEMRSLALGEPDERDTRLDEAVKNKSPEASARIIESFFASSDLAIRASALGRLARLALKDGKMDEALRRFDDSIRAKTELGAVSQQASDRFAQVFVLIRFVRRFSEASQKLSALARLGEQDDEIAAKHPYYAGILANETGDLRNALGSFRESAARAERLEAGRLRRDSLQMQASVLAALGRVPEGLARLEALLSEGRHDLDPCTRANILSAIGWFTTLAVEASPERDPHAQDPIPRFEEALVIYQTTCPLRTEVANVLTSLAVAHELATNIGEARGYLARAREAITDPGAVLASWWEDIEGRIALRQGDPKRALAAYEHETRIAASSFIPEGDWRGALGRARALDALHQTAAADAAFRQAEARLDEESLFAPLGEGRNGFLGRFEASARFRVDSLIGSGRIKEAAQAARISRARLLMALRSIDRISGLAAGDRRRWEEAVSQYRREREILDREAREDWKHSASELAAVIEARSVRTSRVRAALEQALAILGRNEVRIEDLPVPAERELMLVYHPLPSGWVAFGIERGEVTAHRIERIDLSLGTDSLAAVLLLPFAAQIDRASRIRLAPYGTLEMIDFHALPWRGRPLAMTAPVVYAADVGEVTAPPTQSPGSGTAVLIADPRSDLPEAWKEAKIVEARLRARGLRVELLDHDQASYAAVRKALERPDVVLLHYAGHGAFGGQDGWASAFALAGGGWFTVADVLALKRVPPVVVLSACDAARADAARGEAFGIGKAFLVGGSNVVIAAQRPVTDALARMLMDQLHQRALDDPAGSLHIAQRSMLRDAPNADWAAFRALVR